MWREDGVVFLAHFPCVLFLYHLSIDLLIIFLSFCHSFHILQSYGCSDGLAVPWGLNSAQLLLYDFPRSFLHYRFRLLVLLCCDTVISVIRPLPIVTFVAAQGAQIFKMFYLYEFLSDFRDFL